eukprot:4784676-Karenia_brevis.AAC.1
MGALTVLRKLDGGIRGIVSAESIKRLVSKILAQKFKDDFKQACSPYQFGLSTRAGTDCVGHLVRAATRE